MKKTILISTLLLGISPLLYTMKEEVENNSRKLSYFCSFKKKINTDDTNLNMHVKLPLFIQLCVQASHCTEWPQEPLQELLQRFTEGKIAQKEEHKKLYVIMTERDCYYRLMSYIQTYQGYPNDSIINGKEIHLEDVSFMTEEDTIKTENERERIRVSRSAQNKDKEYPQGRCFVGCFSGHSIIRETRIRTPRLKDDKEHHEMVVKQFEQLLNK